MRWIWLFIALTWALFTGCPEVRAQTGVQSLTTLQQRKIATAPDSLILDTTSIAPGSLRISGVPDTCYTLAAHRAMLVWRHKPAVDSVWITYRRLPIRFDKVYQHKSTRLIDSNVLFRLYPQEELERSGSFAEAGKLEYTGSYGRSVSLGNNQDVVLNSAFNLQASGYILDSVKLEAALTDNTIPFQPEGNTQRLQEFDQIFIRLQKGKHMLQAGDYNLDTPPGYFLKYFKRVQGLYYQYNAGTQSGFAIQPDAQIPTSFGSGFQNTQPPASYGAKATPGKSLFHSFGVSGSVAKGQFARNIFQGGEGNQGPYRLTGNNGEQFFIVLAATERVYVDNVLMERGESADYIVNYNTAELRFMPRRMITKDSRIQVEFEYVDRNYLNSLIYAWDEIKLKDKWQLRVQAYSNQDARNQPYLQNLTGEQKRFLAGLGDSVQNAFYPSIATDTLGAGKILYRMTDTVVNGLVYDSVFVYSIDPETARFLPAFAFVGNGKGDYVLSERAANGRVYDWVAPQGGRKQGNYAPVLLLIAPKKQQVFQVISHYAIDSSKRISVELAASNNDPNLFSPIDNQRHWGGATKMTYEEGRIWRKHADKQKLWRTDSRLSYEYVQNRFQAVAPFRNVEFGRDWNVPQTGNRADEHLVDAATRFAATSRHAWSYRLSHYLRGSNYQGLRQILGYDLTTKKITGGFIANVLQATDTFQRIQFLRPAIWGAYTFARTNLQFGARWEAEHNAIRNRNTDTLSANAFSFDITTLYLKTPQQQNWQRSLTYLTRVDRHAVRNQFVKQNRSHNLEARTSIARWHEQSFSMLGTYRSLVVYDTSFIRIRPEETMLGRLEWTGSALKQVFNGNAFYEAGSGQEQKRIYTYVEVPVGQGNFTWNDYNGNGIQEANEFEVALYPDQKRFIRVLSPTNDFVRVNYLNANFSLGIEPSYFWGGAAKKNWQKFVSRVSSQTSVQVANRFLSALGSEVLNPFAQTQNNDAIISTSTAANQNIYFNRNSAVWGIDYNLLYTAGKQLLTYGVEGSDSRQHLYKLRWNATSSWLLQLSGRHGARAYQSALNDRRSYQLAQYSLEPAVTLLYRSVWRTTGSFRYEERKNAAAFGGERTAFQSITVDTRYSKPAAGVLAASFTYTHITFTGQTTAPIAFVVLEALQPGTNYLWRANWERRVGKGIEIQIQYEGRRPAGRDVIHTGTMSVRAIL